MKAEISLLLKLSTVFMYLSSARSEIRVHCIGRPLDLFDNVEGGMEDKLVHVLAVIPKLR
jgi:hypothetical protein